MNRTTIGTIIESLRFEKEYTRKQLCKGLCSEQMLIKIEKDEVDVDKFLLDILLQRLGKSPDKLEVILSDEEYERIYTRDYIEELIWKRKKKSAHILLKNYEKKYAKDSNVQTMFVLRSKAYISYRLENDIKSAETYIRQAIEKTMPGINNENMKKYLLAENEIENMLALCRLLLEQDKNEEAEELLTSCQEYIEKNVTDEEEYSKLNSKSAWLCSHFLVQKGAYMQAYQICENAIEYLRKYGILYFMIPLLEQIIFCGERIGIEKDKDKWKIHYDNLIEIYGIYGKEWYCHDSLFHNCNQTVYHLASEFIRQERQSQLLTQEQLIKDVYAGTENLSRVENGKVMPSRKKFEGLMDNLGIERGKYCGTLIVEDYETLEQKTEMDILIGKGDFEEAQKYLKYMQSGLDCSKSMNRMAIEIYKSIIDARVGKMDARSSYERFMMLLEESALFKNGKIHRVPFYNEILLLNMLCDSLEKIGEDEKSIAIYKKIVRIVDKSKIDKKYQNNIMSLVFSNLDLYDSEKKWCAIGISYELSCGKGNKIYMHFVSQIELEEDENTRRKITRLAYYMSDLFHRETNKQEIKNYYEQTYKEELF